MSLEELATFEHAAALIARETAQLLHYAQLEHERIDAARARGDQAAVRISLYRLARIARQLTFAQVELVHPDDGRYRAAQAVRGYCQEAERAGPWREPHAPVRLGAAA